MENKLKTEHWLYLLFVASLPFSTLFQSKLFGLTVQLPDLLFLIATAGFVVAVITQRETPRWSRFYLCLAAYACALVLSTITSANPAQSAAKLVGKFYLIGIAALTINIVTSAWMLRRVLQAWLSGAAIAVFLSLIGIVLFYLGVTDPNINLVVHPIFGSLPPGNYPRIEGFFLYPAMLCNFLGVSWMFLILFSSTGWLRTRTYVLLGAAMLIVNAFTLTPGLGGIFLSTGYFLRERLKNQRPIIAYLILGLTTLAAVAFFFAASFTLFSYDSANSRMPLIDGGMSPSHRALAWKTSLETFTTHPITGRGVGMPVARSEFIDPSGNRQLLTDAHNTYLSVLGETGILGFAAFMSIVLFPTLSLIRWRSTDVVDPTIKLCLLLALVDAFFYQSLTGSYEDTRHLWVLFGIAGVIGAANFKAQE